jgi:hypothetical protein
VVTTADAGAVITSGLRALADAFPGWNFGLGRVVPGWEAEAVHPASGCRVRAHANGPVTALAMVEAAVKAVRV